MSKTVTLRVDDAIYEMIKTTADGQHRNLSNFIEYATLQYLSSQTYVSDSEMEEILQDDLLVENLGRGKEDIEKGDFTIV